MNQFMYGDFVELDGKLGMVCNAEDNYCDVVLFLDGCMAPHIPYDKLVRSETEYTQADVVNAIIEQCDSNKLSDVLKDYSETSVDDDADYEWSSIFADDVVDIIRGEYQGYDGYVEKVIAIKDGDDVISYDYEVFISDLDRVVRFNEDDVELAEEKCSWYK